MTGSAALCLVPPRMDVVREIEDELGGIPLLAERLSGSGWMVTELVSIIHILHAADGREEDYDHLGAKMIAEGLEVYRRMALSFLRRVITS